MQVDYIFEKCILCMKSPPENWEHIIPESLGGNLQARILCISCNSKFGSELVGNLKENDSIRLAMEYLKSELPTLYSHLMDKATFIGKSEDGSLIRVSNNKKYGPRVLFKNGIDGSRIQDTREASKTLENILTKNKISSIEANSIKKAFAELQEDVPLDVPDNYVFTKHITPQLHPELNPKEKIDNRLPTLIAFEFLAIHIGNVILNEAFDEIRQYIRDGNPTNKVVVEQFAGGNKYDTIHGIVIEPIDKAIQIRVRLFRWITYVVTFNNFNYRGFDSIYLEDLKSHKSLYAKTREEANQGIWYELR